MEVFKWYTAPRLIVCLDVLFDLGHHLAYFEKSVDSLFEVINRHEFEQHVHGHQGSMLSNDSNDPAWYAIRNVVYASGCRLYHSAGSPVSFTVVQEEASGYFSNALSVHSDLLLRRPTLAAVRALLAMVSAAKHNPYL